MRRSDTDHERPGQQALPFSFHVYLRRGQASSVTLSSSRFSGDHLHVAAVASTAVRSEIQEDEAERAVVFPTRTDRAALARQQCSKVSSAVVSCGVLTTGVEHRTAAVVTGELVAAGAQVLWRVSGHDAVVHRAEIGRAASRSPKESCCSPA